MERSCIAVRAVDNGKVSWRGGSSGPSTRTSLAVGFLPEELCSEQAVPPSHLIIPLFLLKPAPLPKISGSTRISLVPSLREHTTNSSKLEQYFQKLKKT